MELNKINFSFSRVSEENNPSFIKQKKVEISEESLNFLKEAIEICSKNNCNVSLLGVIGKDNLSNSIKVILSPVPPRKGDYDFHKESQIIAFNKEKLHQIGESLKSFYQKRGVGVPAHLQLVYKIENKTIEIEDAKKYRGFTINLNFSGPEKIINIDGKSISLNQFCVDLKKMNIKKDHIFTKEEVEEIQKNYKSKEECNTTDMKKVSEQISAVIKALNLNSCNS